MWAVSKSEIKHGFHNIISITQRQCPTGRVFQYWVGSCRVLEKIPGSGSGSGRVGVLKNTIGYFQVSLLEFYSRVIPGIPGISG